jgi:hypothetical protein
VDVADAPLRYWSLFRISLFFVQIPMRYLVFTKLGKLDTDEHAPQNSAKLLAILRSDAWKCTRIGSAIVSMWVLITLVLSLYFGATFQTKHSALNDHKDYAAFSCFEGEISPCLYRLCWLSLIIFTVHIIFIIFWLRKVVQIKQYIFQSIFTEIDLQLHTCASHTEQLCSICLQPSSENHRHHSVQLIKCKHVFHVQCIEQWFMRKTECPLCKQDYADCANLKKSGESENVSLSDRNVSVVRHRRFSKYSSTLQALDLLLQSPSCGHSSFFSFMPN